MASASRPSWHWYQVVVCDVVGVIGPPLRARVQAAGVDAALREVMRINRIAFTPLATIWRLGDRGCLVAPSQRVNVRCRLPRRQEVR